MTLGEKLAKLRKENNHTQEQLAELLGVSRQSVSKWESDLAYPETDKLVRLGELYGCSLDYLLKDHVEMPKKLPHQISFDLRALSFERKSKRMVGGLPLWHINIGFGRTARGVFAVGLSARGVVAVGLFALGLLSVGLFSIGLLAFGIFALGLLAAGSIAVGVIAFGAICFGLLAVGAIAVGQFSVGALAIGNYLAIGDHAKAMIAIGKSEATAWLYQTNAVTEANRQEIIALLDRYVPMLLSCLAELSKIFL